MMLPDFLLARIAEDETVARAAASRYGAEAWQWVDSESDEPITGPQYGGVITGSLRSVESFESGRFRLPVFLTSSGGSPEITWEAASHITRHDPARVLADCGAKRGIVELYLSREAQAHEDNTVAAHATGLLLAVRQLATTYADHPDYDEEWKP